MPTITFKAKVETIYNMDDSPAYQRIKVPAITRSHCDMAAFRSDRKFGSYANSDLFAGMLRRALKAAGVDEYLRLDRIPATTTVDTSGFLAKVTITV